MESNKESQIVCLLREKIEFKHILSTLQELVASGASVVLLLIEPAVHAVRGWDAEDHHWREKLNNLPLTVYGDVSICALSDTITGIGSRQMAGIIRNADFVLPL